MNGREEKIFFKGSDIIRNSGDNKIQRFRIPYMWLELRTGFEFMLCHHNCVKSGKSSDVVASVCLAVKMG